MMVAKKRAHGTISGLRYHQVAVRLIPVVGPMVAVIAGCLGLGAIVLRTMALRREAQGV